MNPYPPKWALSFLRWYCREDYLEEFEGNVLELFEEEYEQDPSKANRFFIWTVLRHFRPGFIKSITINQPTNPKDMFLHHLLLSYRGFKRHKATFLINLIGFSTGIAAALLICLWVLDELAVDKFHENNDRLYQVMRTTESRPGKINTNETNSDLLAPALLEEFPEIDKVVAVDFDDCNGILSTDNQNLKAKGTIAGADFFQVFSYPLLHANPIEVLKGINNMVISDELAIAFFGSTTAAINQSLSFEHEDYEGIYTVAGVFPKKGYQSSEDFDFLISHDLYLSRRNPEWINWNSNSMSVYLTLKEGIAMESINGKIKNFVRDRFQIKSEPEGMDWVGQLFLRPYSGKYLYGNYENGVQAGGRIEYVGLFSMIALFILLIASINFMNLSTAQASRKMKQVAIKKVVGVNRKHLMGQFLGEALLLTTLSFIVASLLVYFLIPSFNAITGKELVLRLNGDFAFSALGIILITGLLSGSYPAFYLSAFKPIEILKGRLSTSMSEFWIRKGLVVFQFCISILLIVAVSVVYRQIEYIQSKNLGYDKDNLLMFDRQEKLFDKLETFLNEINSIPGVRSSTLIEDVVTDISGNTGVYSLPGQAKGTINPHMYEAVVGFDFIKTLNIEMLAGRSFSRQFNEEDSKMILNERAVKILGLADPVGSIIKWKGQEKEVIGVSRDFHGQSLYEEIKPMAILNEPDETTEVLVRLQAGTEQSAIARLQELYNEYYPGLPFEYRFLDEEYRSLYLAEQRVATLSQYFAGIAIIISCLGLFGLATFSAERRFKEIGIRKVLGSSNFAIVSLLSKDFLWMVLIANLITLPLGYILSQKWLNGFAYTINLSWWLFLGAGVSAFLIAWLTVGFQTYKAARVNPVESLRSE